MIYYKVLSDDGSAHHSGSGRWHRNGAWMPEIKGKLIPCRRGYHLCRREHLIEWIGPAIWEAKADGDIVGAGKKVVVRRARLVRRFKAWNERTMRLFACDCAERALRFNDDKRCVETIAVARRFANGKATRKELAAARDAAGAAARDAARAAAWDAAGNAAWNAARDAAWAAAWDAARGAAWNAAWAAAWNAARAAARDAEREWQTERLFQHLTGEIKP